MMKMGKYAVIGFFVLLLSSVARCEDYSQVDSLKKIVSSDAHDSLRVKALFAWDDIIYASDPALDVQLNEKIVEISEKHLSVFHFLENNRNFYAAAKGKALNNLGLVYQSKGNYPLAMEFYAEALKLSEQAGDLKLSASAMGNIANIHLDQGETDQALDAYRENLEFFKKLNDEQKMATTWSNMGLVYHEKKNYLKAHLYLEKSLEMRKKTGDEYGEAMSLNNIGNLLVDEKKYEEALNYFKESKKIRQQLDDVEGLAGLYVNFGNIYYHTGNQDSAVIMGKLSLEMATEMQHTELLKDAHMLLKSAYLKKGMYKEAFENLEMYYKHRDQMISEENKQEITRQKYKYEYERKSAAEKMKHEEEKIINETQLEYEKKQRYVLYLGLALLIVFAYFMYNRFRITARQKKIIELQKTEAENQKKQVEIQKEIIEEKQKEVMDSITYAKRLQQAILVTPDEFNKYLPDSFLMYKPKDIVAGDFYFFEEKGNYLFVAAADCTGHGVPGAMVSVVCSNALSRSVHEFGITDPGKILDKTRELVITTFEKSGSNIKDGMDISLVAIKKDKSELWWAGANNPLWYCKGQEMMEYKPDKQPVGKSEDNNSFRSHHLVIEKGMIVYLFTDGYPDQFGGNPVSRTGGKKFRYSRFRELLVSVYSQSMSQQKNTAEKVFEEWKGDFEQTDDICLIAIKF